MDKPLSWTLSTNMFRLPVGLYLEVVCRTCMRVWAATPDKDYESVESFDRTNRLQCPWCHSYINVVRTSKTKEGITNGFAFR